MKNLIIIAILLLACNISFAQRILMGREFAKKQVKSAIKDKEVGQLSPHPLTIDKETAISVAEVYLFKTYGKKQILTERPYEVYLIDGYWWMMGTIPIGAKGGGFEIILDARNGKIIRLTHYK